MLLAPANTFIVCSLAVRRSTGSASPPTAPIFKDKMKELRKMQNNVINVRSQNLLMKQPKYYYKIEMGKKEKNIIRLL